MTAFRLFPLFKLYNIAKKKSRYDGLGHKEVHINERAKYKHELVQIYRDICWLYNDRKKMTWAELDDFLFNQLKDVAIVFE